MLSSRRTIRPVYNRDEDEDEQRRDPSGRKRVDVIDCLLESSSSDDDDQYSSKNPSNQIVWLTFAEICHIRSVLSRTLLSPDERVSSSTLSNWNFFSEQNCFRCGKQLKTSLFTSLFSSSTICLICQRRICQTCSVDNYHPPSSSQMLPIYLPHLLQLQTSRSFHPIQTNSKGKTICYACAQIMAQSSLLAQHRSVLATYPNRQRSHRQLPSLPTNSKTIVTRF